MFKNTGKNGGQIRVSFSNVSQFVSWLKAPNDEHDIGDMARVAYCYSMIGMLFTMISILASLNTLISGNFGAWLLIILTLLPGPIIIFAFATTICGLLGKSKNGKWGAWIFAICVIISVTRIFTKAFADFGLRSLVGGIFGFDILDVLLLVIDIAVAIVELIIILVAIGYVGNRYRDKV